ncbi:nicotinate (nicotinamide) nucleotide adenylyltransferase [Undibacterium sp. SXout7W]|uniref:nicotinate (nicotinamide) nucleotide adenylyltransferase n=1 Tax=Undibacterium sp. SXout7W TaxID=3413049 RepID=UPI003BF28D34
MGIETISSRCVLVLGGSFDPVHVGHLALAQCATHLLQPDELRIIPTGQPWQKSALTATSEQRVRMLELAFENWSACHVSIDLQEIQRADNQQASYTIESLRQLRHEVGPQVSVVFAMGADQLQNLHTWREWQQLLDVAHLFAAARPGFNLDHVAPEVAAMWHTHSISIQEMRTRPQGGTCMERNLAQDVSSTQLRSELKKHNPTTQLLVPHKVLDYLQQHTIY